MHISQSRSNITTTTQPYMHKPIKLLANLHVPFVSVVAISMKLEHQYVRNGLCVGVLRVSGAT
jgi:hypothetical protein